MVRYYRKIKELFTDTDITFIESLRSQPSVFGLIKICTKDHTMPLLPDQNVPVIIPAKTPIVLNFTSVYQ